ncbi:MAG: hypothetical protein GX868_17990 [Actinobacteria bacterium]|nr:hypothetical protein [Actinomycetota bacterium]
MSQKRLFTSGTSRARTYLIIPAVAVAAVLGACVPDPVPTGPTTTTEATTTTTEATTTTTEATTTTTTIPEPVDPTIVGEACQPTSGVTVVVDFTALDNTIQIGCAEGEQADGFAALAATGFTIGNESGAGTVCTIDGLPSQGYPYCWLTGGYWSYWKAPNRTTAWDFSPVGAGDGPLAQGSVEGWSWAPAFNGSAPRVTIADLADHTPVPACEIPDAPVISVIANNETLPFTIDGGGAIEIAVLEAGESIDDATWTEASSLSLSGYTGQIRVLARSAEDCTVGDIFDATYDVQATYAGRPGLAGSDSQAVQGTSASFVGWASGFADYLPGLDVTAGFQTPNNAVGSYSTSLVVLGNGGKITMTFATPIANGAGNDFAVFENGFNQNATSELLFTELAYVEVSSNGTDFVRFDSASQQATKVGAFAFQSPRLLGGLAGKDPAGWGTVFDLEALTNKKLVRNGTVDLNNITHVRIVDIVGDRDYPTVGDRYFDSFGREIYDTHKTTGSGGFDLQAVGVLNQASN